MAGTIINGSHLTGIVLNTPATENPATIAATGYITNTTTAYDGDAVFGLAGTPWRVTNLGTVNATGAGSAGVFLSAGGTIINGSSSNTAALVEGYQNGIFINGAGTVTNFGTVAATGTNASAPGTGIRLAAGGNITNGSTADHTAEISSAQGIAISIGGTTGGIGTVTNFGTIITDTTDTAGVFIPAIYLGGGGTVTNYGLMEGSHPVSSNGYQGVITIRHDYVTIRNFGTITSANVSDGIHLNHGGTVINGSTSATNALISGSNAGIVGGGNPDQIAYGVGASATILNYGTIESSGTHPAVGFISGGTVTNHGLISGAGAGVFLTGAGGAVTNFGAIQAAGIAGVGVYLGAGGSVTNKRAA